MVSVYTSSVAAAALAVTLYASTALLADAHQRIMNPPPKYTVNDKDKNWSPIAFMEGQYPTNADLLGFIKSKGGTTLRDFMDNKSLYKVINDPAVNFECGYTDPNGPRQPVPADGMIRSSGYTHEGPCEIWLDDTRVLKGDNCHKSVTATKGSYKIDWSACKGNCMLRWYWFGNRFVKNKYSWQVYKACIPMKGGSGGVAATTTKAPDAETDNDDDSATTKPATTKSPPATATPKPSFAPANATEKPVAGESSSTPSKGCRRLLD